MQFDDDVPIPALRGGYAGIRDMSDPVEAAILLIKERARADAAEARLKRLIDAVENIAFGIGVYVTIAASKERLRAVLREARGEEAKT